MRGVNTSPPTLRWPETPLGDPQRLAEHDLVVSSIIEIPDTCLPLLAKLVVGRARPFETRQPRCLDEQHAFATRGQRLLDVVHESCAVSTTLLIGVYHYDSIDKIKNLERYPEAAKQHPQGGISPVVRIIWFQFVESDLHRMLVRDPGGKIPGQSEASILDRHERPLPSRLLAG